MNVGQADKPQIGGEAFRKAIEHPALAAERRNVYSDFNRSPFGAASCDSWIESCTYSAASHQVS